MKHRTMKERMISIFMAAVMLTGISAQALGEGEIIYSDDPPVLSGPETAADAAGSPDTGITGGSGAAGSGLTGEEIFDEYPGTSEEDFDLDSQEQEVVGDELAREDPGMQNAGGQDGAPAADYSVAQRTLKVRLSDAVLNDPSGGADQLSYSAGRFWEAYYGHNLMEALDGGLYEEDIAPGIENPRTPLAVEVSGMLPGNIQVAAEFIEYGSEQAFSEDALLSFDLRLEDENGQPYTPESELTVVIGGHDLAAAMGEGQSPLVYDFRENPEREDPQKPGDYKASATVYRDFSEEAGKSAEEIQKIRGRLLFLQPRANNDVLLTQDNRGLRVDRTAGTVSFPMQKGSVRMIVTAVEPERSLTDVTPDGAAGFTVQGMFSADTSAALERHDSASADLTDYDWILAAAGVQPGTGALVVYDFTFTSAEAGEYTPDRPVSAVIYDAAVGEQVMSGNPLTLYQIPEDGSCVPVAYAGFSAEGVSFTADRLDTLVVAGPAAGEGTGLPGEVSGEDGMDLEDAGSLIEDEDPGEETPGDDDPGIENDGTGETVIGDGGGSSAGQQYLYDEQDTEGQTAGGAIEEMPGDEEMTEPAAGDAPAMESENAAETEFPDDLIEDWTEEAAEAAGEEAAEEFPEETTEEVIEFVTEEVMEDATENVTDEVIEFVTEEVMKEVMEEVTENVTENVTEEMIEFVTEEAAEGNMETLTEAAVEFLTETDAKAGAETAAEAVTETETEAAAEHVTEPLTEAESEKETETPAESETANETETPAESETEEETEAETEEAAERTTEATTEAATEATTEAISDVITENEAESISEAEAEPKQSYPARIFEGRVSGVSVLVDAPEGAFPEGTTMNVKRVLRGDVLAEIREAVAEDFVEVQRVQAVDISFLDQNMEEVEPLVPASVVMSVTGIRDEQDATVVHVNDEGTVDVQTSEMVDTGSGGKALVFDAGSFSLYAVVVTETIETRYIDAYGNTYIVEVGYGEDAGIPAGAQLEVTELPEGSEECEAYVQKAMEALGMEGEEYGFARAFDISIIDPATGRHCQPAKPVAVSVRLLMDDVQEVDRVDVVHFPDSHAANADSEAGETELLAASVNGEAVEFESTGFSPYVIIGHEGGEVKEPRVEFHFIDRYTDEEYQAGIDITQTTSARPYNFPNTKIAGDGYQTTQILKDGETLDLINDPANISYSVTDPETGRVTNVEKFFFGWYVVDMESDSSSLDAGSGQYTGSISFNWPESPNQIHFEQTISITANDTNGDGKITVPETGGSATDTVTWTIGDVTGNAPIDRDGNAHVYLAPLYEDFFFINFNKLPRDLYTTNAETLMTRKLVVFGSAATASVRIGNVMCESPDPTHKVFSGWERADGNGDYEFYQTVEHVLDENGNIINREKNSSEGSGGYYISVTKTDEVSFIELFPKFDEARWLYFNTGKSGNGASYVGAAFRLTNDSRGSTDNEFYYFDKGFFTGDTTVTHLGSRPGYNFKGWYLFARIDGDTGEITNLTTPQDVEVSFLDENSHAHTVTINTTAIQIVDAAGVIQDVGSWYVTPTYTGSEITGGTISTSGSIRLFEVLGDTADTRTLRFYRAMDDMTFYARWEPGRVNYTVVYWLENANDDDYTLMYYKAVESTAGAQTAAAPTAAGDTAQREVNGRTQTYSPYEEYKLTFAHLSEDQDKDEAGVQSGIQQKTVNGDGSTIVNVYYDRNQYTLRFDIGYSYVTNGTRTYYVSGITNSQNYNQFLTNDRISCGTTIPEDFIPCGTYDQRNGNTTYTIYYYDLTAKYGESIADRWPDTQPDRPGNNAFIGWIAREDSYYWHQINQSSIKGDYEAMDEGVIYVGPLNNYTATTAENGIAHEFRCRYQANTNKYVYRVYFWDPGLPGTGFPSTPDLEMKVNSKGTPKYRAVAAYSGYTDPADVVVKLVTGNENGPESDLPSSSNAGYNPYYVSSVGYNAMIINFYYRPNLHNITYKYGAGSPRVGTEFSTASIAYYYRQSLADANVNQDNAVADTPQGYSFAGWYDNQDGVGSRFNFNSTMLDGDIVLYAVYTPIRYRVMIDPNGGEIDHVNHGYDNASANPAVKGYSDYWWDADGNAVTYASGSGVTPFATFNRAAISGERPADAGYNRSQSTYINANYGTVVSEYTVERRYVPITDAAAAQYEASGGTVYYYINAQYKETDGSGLPSDCRNALYVTGDELPQYYRFYRDWTQGNIDGGYITGTTVLDYDTWKALYVSTQKYRACNGNETWTFLGWYKNDESMPYNFSDPVTGPFTLKARWRLDGGYSIEYIPKYIMSDGAEINGTMTSWRDPAEAYISYADGAETQIYKAPTGLKKDDVEVTDDSVIFRGWALVSRTGTDSDPVYTPLEKDSSGNITTYYLPSDAYTVNAANAGSDSKIYFQAVYQYREHSDRRPDTANLTLDANTGFVNTADSSALPAWRYPGTNRINTEDHLTGDNKPTQILFGDMQSNAAVHLYRYATELTKDAQGKAVTDAHQFFEHPGGYFLLGFDDSPTEGDFAATYPADSVIAITRTDEKTLYAVWEPMVYVTFVNNTGVTANDISFGLSSSLDVLRIINAADGLYDRTPISDYQNITLKNGESITLAFPFGAEQTLTVSGTNTLGVGKKLIWNSSVDLVTGSGTESWTTAGSASGTVSYTHGDHSHDLVSGEVNNTKPFSFTETMIENANALTITFTSVTNDYALLLDDNYEGGGMQEIDFATEDIKPVNGTPGTQVLPTTSTRIGYSFIGWAYDPNAAVPDFSADKPAGHPWTILDLDNENGGFFSQTVETDGVMTRTLYGVWEAKTDAIYVFKEVPEPGSTEQAFTFTMGITGKYRIGSGNSANYTAINEFASFRLRHGEYLKINSRNYNATSGNNQTVYAESAVKVYTPVSSADGTTTYAEDTGRSQTVRWEKTGVKGSNSNGFEGLKLSVSETPASYYDTSIRLSSQKNNKSLTLGTGSSFNNSQLPQTAAANTVSWVNTDDGGTLVFVNQRQTCDVTVSKTLTGNTAAAALFNYSASYTDTCENVSGQTVTTTKTLHDFTVTSGSTGMIGNLPAGVSLTVTEAADADNNYDTYVSIDGAAERTSKSTGAFTVASDHTAAFRNVLKSYPVTFKLADQDGNTTINGMFSLSSSVGSLGSNLYANASGAVLPPGVFYTSGKFWADTYTLTQTIIPTGYIGLSGPVTIRVTGSGISSSDENVTVSGNAADGYVITVTNYRTVDITLKAGLLDPLVSQRTFSFAGTYRFRGKTYDLGRNLLADGDTPAAVTLTAFSTDDGEVASNFEPKTVRIPVGAAELTIWEDTTQITTAPDTIATTYDTKVKRNSGTLADSSSWSYEGAVEDADNGDVITFYNSKKTTDITVTKAVLNENKSGSFSFTAALLYGAGTIKGYPIFINGTPNESEDDERTDAANGTYTFTLSDGGSRILTVPVGAKLTVQETGVTDGAAGADLDIYDTSVLTTLTNGGGRFTGAADFDTDSRLYTLPVVPGTPLTVSFSNAWIDGFDIVFLKTDGFGAGLSGAAFTLFTDEDCAPEHAFEMTFQDGERTATVSSDGTASYKDKDGNTVRLEKGEVLLSRVAPGTYYMKETEAPVGFEPDPAIYQVTVSGTGEPEIRRKSGDTADSWDVELYKAKTREITVGGTTQDVVQYILQNESSVKRRVILRKVAKDSCASLKGAEFRIFRADMSEVINGDYDHTDECYRSSDSGVYFIDQLPLGNYYLLETQNPAGAAGDNTGKVFILQVTADGTMQRELGSQDTDGTLLRDADGLKKFTGDAPAEDFIAWMTEHPPTPYSGTV